MHADALRHRSLAQRTVTCQKSPGSRFGDRECKRIRKRKACVLLPHQLRSHHLARCKGLYDESVGDQLVAQCSCKFIVVEQVRHGKLIGQRKHLANEVCSLQIDQDRGV